MGNIKNMPSNYFRDRERRCGFFGRLLGYKKDLELAARYTEALETLNDTNIGLIKAQERYIAALKKRLERYEIPTIIED